MKSATVASLVLSLLLSTSPRAWAGPTEPPTPAPDSPPASVPPASDTDPNFDDTGPTPNDPPLAAPVAPAPPLAAKTGDDTQPDDDSDWYQELDLDAFLSAAYVHNFGFTNPAGVNVGRLFDQNDDSFKLDLATLTLQWKARAPGDVGFRLDISHGIVVPVVLGGADVAMLQAYMRYIIPIGSGLHVDIGSFLTHIGSETVEGFETANATYSHGYIFSLFTPPTMTGLRLSYDFAHVVQATFWLTNGWAANVLDDNSAKSLGLQLNIEPTNGVRINVAYLTGAEKPSDNHDWRHMLNAYVEVRPDDVFTARVEATYGHETNEGNAATGVASGPSVQWWGIAALLQAQIDVFGITARAEYIDNEDNFANVGGKLVEWTISPSVRLHEAFLLRADVRQDRSVNGQPLFNGPAGGAFTKPATTQQTTLSLNAVLAY